MDNYRYGTVIYMISHWLVLAVVTIFLPSSLALSPLLPSHIALIN